MATKKKSRKTKQNPPQITVDTAYAQALNHFNAGQYPEVDRLCTAIIQAVPNHIDAINLIGVVAQRLNLHEQAIEQFSRALEIDDSRAMLLVNMGISLNQLGRKKEAVKVLESALKKEPDNRQAAELLKNIDNNSAANDGERSKAQKELVKGVGLHQVGSLDKAIACYHRVLELQPNNPQAIGNMAAALQVTGDLKKAVAYYRKALDIQPDNGNVLSNLGLALTELGDLDDGVKILKKAVAVVPGFATAYYNLGNALQKQNRLHEAIENFNQAIRINPGFIEAYSNLGNALKGQDNLEEAIASYKKALTINPDYVEALNNLGIALKDSGNFLDAIECCQKAIIINPGYASAHNNLGLGLQAMGKLAEAITCYQKALSLREDYVEALNNLGYALCEQGQFAEAMLTLKKAISHDPGFAIAYYNLGNAQVYLGKLDDSIKSFKQAIAIKPGYAQAYSNLGKAFSDQCKLEEAIVCFKKALLIQPDMVQTYSNLLLCSQYIPNQTLNNLFVLHKECANIPLLSIKQQCFSHKNDNDPGRQLKIGFVSADFGHHPIGYFLSGFFNFHNKQEIEIICYSDRIADDITLQLQGYADKWFETKNLLDDELAAKIYADDIDILVDLAGHTAHNRLTMFAKKPAPIQVSWAG
ncbi:MAG: tetratricopeptide repeat protein, partial [Magnetococcales bacterium]|nr:tetratricopeptide repeat protein [Magnetococcales bacterium]